jgi:glucan phosphoethanolaminetransferase (alkaline phosphatase superfamily)
LRRTHLIVGLLGVVAFLLTGQVMGRHVPNIHSLSAEVRMMYVSRHIYLLGATLVNLVLGLYLKLHSPSWRRPLQQTGSLLILLSAVSLLLAFFAEPALGLAGRGWRSFFGMIALFAGVMAHLVASLGSKPN